MRMFIADWAYRMRTIEQNLGFKKALGWFLLCIVVSISWMAVVFSYFPQTITFKIMQFTFIIITYFILTTKHLYDFARKKRRKSSQNINNNDS